ncbi:MAG: hypothetical protein JXL80_17180 [Planctomycetes bacterium]|nr:hypothetical protein [Planctomycetota bacterium]
MAIKFDQDAVFKYADKVFVALAGAFLIFAIIMLALGKTAPVVSYDDVVNSLNDARTRQTRAHVDQFLVGTDELAALPEDQRKTVALVQETPYFHKQLPSEISRYPELADKKFVGEVNYSVEFLRRHDTLPQPWITDDKDRPVPYKSPVEGGVRDRKEYHIPPLQDKDGQPKRIAPKDLKVVSDKGYAGTGKEKDGELGTDYFYNSGQFKLDVTQQILWIREYAEQQTISSVVFTGVDVQRRDVLPDGSYSDWKDIKAADCETVKSETLIPQRPRPEDLDPKLLDTDERRRKLAVDFVNKRMKAVWQKRQADVLRPPFYAMTGKEWLQPYEVLQFDVDKAEVVGETAPKEGEGWLTLEELEKEEKEKKKAQKIEVEGWFNDVLSKDDLGKTFQYRVRVRMFNPLFGALPQNSVPEERYVVEVPCNWSEPSESITVDPAVKFFFVGRAQVFGGEVKANVDMFRWIHGKWYHAKAVQFDVGSPIAYSKVFDIEVPDKKNWVVAGRARIDFISSATVVDVTEATTIYSGQERTVNKLVYSTAMDDGSLSSRIDIEDRDSRGAFEKSRKEEEERLKAVKRRTVRDDTSQPDRMSPEEGMPPEDMIPPEDMMPPDRPPPRWGDR